MGPFYRAQRDSARAPAYAQGMTGWVLIFLGGGLGALARYGVGLAASRAFGPDLPWGTLACNVLGGLAMGALAAALLAGGGSENLRLFAGVGLLGGFTTFSAFSLETAAMLQRGDLALAGGYALASVVGSVLALFAGMALMRSLAP
jgi:CrcB protein